MVQETQIITYLYKKSREREYLSSTNRERFAGKIRDFEGNYFFVRGASTKILGAVLFSKSVWDTEMLGVDVAIIDAILTVRDEPCPTALYEQLLFQALIGLKKMGTQIVFLKVSTKNLFLRKALMKNGYAPRTKIIYFFLSLKKKTIVAVKRSSASICIYEPMRNDYGLLCDIMARGFTNRLLRERMLKKENVRKLYRDWAMNDLRGRVEKVLAVKYNGRKVGFIAMDTVCTKRNKYGFIDMIVVKEEFKGMGIGRELLSSALDFYSERAKGIILATESDNAQAVTFYKKIGFKIFDEEYYYHLYPRAFNSGEKCLV